MAEIECAKAGRLFKYPKCLNECIGGDDFQIVEGSCVEIKYAVLELTFPKTPALDFRKKCHEFGRVYRDEKCTKKCIKVDYVYSRGICIKDNNVVRVVKVNKRIKKKRMV